MGTKTKIELESILEKYIIVVDGDEKKVVYDVDDSSIFSASVTGCGRGARNAVLSEKTFKTLEDAQKGIDCLEDWFRYKFKAIKVSELKCLSEVGWDILIDDIKIFNFMIDIEKERKLKEEEENMKKSLEFKNKVLEIIETGCAYSIEEDENSCDRFIIRCYGTLSDYEQLSNTETPNSNMDSLSNRLFPINTILHTKDGRIIGNAIVVGHEDKFNIVKTDYGRTVRFTDEEVAECFHVAYSDLTEDEKQRMMESIGSHKHSV